MPKVSVIIATHNRAHFLRDAVESVLAQTYQDWELIVIDDGSTDGTREIVASYVRSHPEIRYFYQVNQGAPRSRARSIGLAKGEYLAFLDDDDLFLPHKLSHQVEYLERHPDVGLVYSYVNLVDYKKKFIGKWPVTPARNFLELVKECTIQPNSLLVRRECLDRLGTFCTSLKRCDDYEMWLRIGRFYAIAFLAEPVGLYRRHKGNMGRHIRGRYASHLTIFQGLLKEKLSSRERREVRRALALPSYFLGADELDEGNFREATRYFFCAVCNDPWIGLRISWSRFSNPAYRFLRAYFVVIYCSLLACKLGLGRERYVHA